MEGSEGNGASPQLSKSEWGVKVGPQSRLFRRDSQWYISERILSLVLLHSLALFLTLLHLSSLPSPLLFLPILFFQYLHFMPSRMYLQFLIKAL